MSFKDNNEQKIAKLDKVRTVAKHGKDLLLLRITASSHDFAPTGSFARDMIQLAETPKTCEEATLDLIYIQQDTATCSLGRIVANQQIDGIIKQHNTSCPSFPISRDGY